MKDKLYGLGLMNFDFSAMMINQNIEERELTEELDLRNVDLDLDAPCLVGMNSDLKNGEEMGSPLCAESSFCPQGQGYCCPKDGEQLWD